MSGPPELQDPTSRPREGKVDPLTLIPAQGFPLDKLLPVKQAAAAPVLVAFPVAGPEESANLEKLLAILWPLVGPLVDQVWVACSNPDLGDLARLPGIFPGLRLLPVSRRLPADQEKAPLGKGAAMRALLYHLVVQQGLTDPRAVIQFLDADILPAYFHPGWVLGPVGAVLWFEEVEAAKVVYWRPQGGRLNALVRSLFGLAPHPGVQQLMHLAYLLSGEMAATLKCWTRLPFRCGYGVEMQILLSFALDLLKLAPPAPDLTRLVQVYVGQMDHRHAFLTSSRARPGLDQMAAAVIFTFWDVLRRLDVFRWQSTVPYAPYLHLPIPREEGHIPPEWLEIPLEEHLLPPLSLNDEVFRALLQGPG